MIIPTGQSQVLPVLLLGEDIAALFNVPGIAVMLRRLEFISVKLKIFTEVPTMYQGLF